MRIDTDHQRKEQEWDRTIERNARNAKLGLILIVGVLGLFVWMVPGAVEWLGQRPDPIANLTMAEVFCGMSTRPL